MAEAGAQVAAGDAKRDGLAEVVQAMRDLPGKVHVHKLDVSSEAEVGAFVDWAIEVMGGPISARSSEARGSAST